MTTCKTHTRKAAHSLDFKDKLLNRLKRVEGQVRGIQKMISDDVYCDDVLIQISAVRSALASVSKELFEAHLNSCVLDQVQSGSTEVIEELKKTIQRMVQH